MLKIVYYSIDFYFTAIQETISNEYCNNYSSERIIIPTELSERMIKLFSGKNFTFN